MRWTYLFDCLKSQMLEYDGSAWTEKGRMKIGRRYHAIIEANLPAICGGMGNLNSVEREQVYVKLYFRFLCQTQIRQI